MNISEEYIMVNKGLIILISGLSGTNKSLLAKEIEKDFKLKLIDINEYCINENNVPIVEIFGLKIKDWDDVNTYNWTKINEDVSKYKVNGCVVVGDMFPKSKFKQDKYFHIHLTISKEKLVEKRKIIIQKNEKGKCNDLKQFTNNLLGFINKITYPHYIKYREDSKIDFWIKSDENTIEEMYNKTFDFIQDRMIKSLDEYYSIHDREQTFIKFKKSNENKSNEIKSDDDTDEINSDDTDEIESDLDIDEKSVIETDFDKDII